MATISRSLSAREDSKGRSELMLRINASRTFRIRVKSGVFVPKDRFADGKFVFPRANQALAAELRKTESSLRELEEAIFALCDSVEPEKLTKDMVEKAVYLFHHPKRERKPREEEPEASKTLIDLVEALPEKRALSVWRRKRYAVLGRSLRRFELYRKARRQIPSAIDFESFTTDMLMDYESFLRNEPEIFDKYPRIFEKYPAETRKVRKSRRPSPKGDNTIVNIFACLRTFFRWAIEEGLTQSSPFARYKGKTTERYGHPVYISVEERDRIADFDLSGNKPLAVQRDIFVFHCCIGCRVSDLMRLTPDNIINGYLEYIASKTKGERPEVIRIPLTQRALRILDKYKGVEKDGKILPFISQQKYNVAIKRIFKECGVTRVVTVLNPTTGEEERRPINELASSHMARRTFVGNLYKKVKDPNLVGSLSGHKEGSRAFARYRDIDDDIKKELIGFIE